MSQVVVTDSRLGCADCEQFDEGNLTIREQQVVYGSMADKVALLGTLQAPQNVARAAGATTCGNDKQWANTLLAPSDAEREASKR